MSKILVRLVGLVAAVGLMVATAGTAAASSGFPGGQTPPDDSGRPETRGYERGQAALARLGDRLPDVAKRYGVDAAELRHMLLSDKTLAVDASLEIAYFDVLAPGEVAADDAGASAPAGAPPVDGAEFQLESLPGAAKTIYLDFDGHTTTPSCRGLALQ